MSLMSQILLAHAKRNKNANSVAPFSTFNIVLCLKTFLRCMHVVMMNECLQNYCDEVTSTCVRRMRNFTTPSPIHNYYYYYCIDKLQRVIAFNQAFDTL